VLCVVSPRVSRLCNRPSIPACRGRMFRGRTACVGLAASTIWNGTNVVVKETGKIGQGKAGPGRPKGTPNKTTALLKDAIIVAATKAGGAGGMEAFLKAQAEKENNAPFMALLGKVLPMQVTGEDGGSITVEIVKRTYE